MVIRSLFLLILTTLLYNTSVAQTQSMFPEGIIIEMKQDVETKVLILNSKNQSGERIVKINNEPVELLFQNGIAKHNVEEAGLYLISYHDGSSKTNELYHFWDRGQGEIVQRYIPLWLSIVPPLIAIILALVFKEVVTALALGIFSGAFIANGFHFQLIFKSFFNVLDKYILHALTDSSHVSVILFSILIGGMVAIISKNGGMAGIVDKLSVYAKTRKSAQLITWFLGIAIFFDDYANTLIVGNTMRPVTDKFKISREKLAYLVDSTAAPIAAIAFITTWIGAELGYIESAIEGLNLGVTPYAVFINSLQYSFYPIFTLVFILILVLTGKDFGPMLSYEQKAYDGKKAENIALDEDEMDEINALNPDEDTPKKWYNALLPILVVISTTMAVLWMTGTDSEPYNSSLGFFKNLSNIVGASDSYQGLLWGSLSGLFVAILMSISTKIMSLSKSMDSMMMGFKTMLPAIVILILAWSLAAATQELNTATFLTGVLEGNLNPIFLPAITFIMAGLIAFSTGSSWGTMAILYPLILPAAWTLSQSAGMSIDESMSILYNVTSVVLAGSVLGDHCSPISDTTILSSLASNCNHITHVRTQLPYALTVGGISLLFSVISIWLPFYVNIPLGIGALFLIVKFFGKKIKTA